ncbi:MAG TPA: ribosomal protein L13e [Candidatus Paceibacterota bacterium]|nr:ribosomal protein L13e [Candidatus Paceibacterota bacterium]
MVSRNCLVTGKRNFERRGGRGFSRGELKEAGTTIKQALQAGINVDRRRRSVHKENVELLKTQLQSLVVTGKRAPKSGKKSKKG